MSKAHPTGSEDPTRSLPVKEGILLDRDGKPILAEGSSSGSGLPHARGLLVFGVATIFLVVLLAAGVAIAAAAAVVFLVAWLMRKIMSVLR